MFQVFKLVNKHTNNVLQFIAIRPIYLYVVRAVSLTLEIYKIAFTQRPSLICVTISLRPLHRLRHCTR